MSKRDHRRLLIAKEKHKAELVERVKVSQARVWQVDIDKSNTNKLRGAIIQDLHNICNVTYWSGARLQSFIKVEKPPSFEIGNNKKCEIVDMIHPFVGKFQSIFKR
jgi:transcriptional regulator with XRE-family HTH domain